MGWYRAWHNYKYANLAHFSMVLLFVGFLSYTSIAPQFLDKGVQGKIENKLPATTPTEVSWDEYHASRSRMKDIEELPNGKMRAKVFNEPVQYLDEDGQWQDINTEIKTSQNGRKVGVATVSGRQSQDLFVEEAPYEANFSTSAEDDLVIKTEDGFWKNSYLGAKNTFGVVEGNKIVYEDVYKNVNIERSFNGDNVKQDIILKEKGHPLVFKEKLETDLRLEINDDNSITYYKDNKEVAYTPRIFLIDDRNQEHDVELEYKNNILEIKVPENRDFYYPAVIDPTYTLATSDGYTGSSSSFGAAATTLFAGSYDIDGKANYVIDRSVIRFNTSGIGSGSTVTSTSLYMYLNDATYGVSNTDVYRNTGAFSFSNFGTPIVGTLVPGALNTWSNTSITTSYINKTGYTWFTLRGNEANGNYNTGWASYGTAQKPYLDITYNRPAPDTPTNPGGTALSTSSIRWSWADATLYEDGYRVHAGSGTDPEPHGIVCSTAANATSCDESDLSANTAYTRHIHAYNNDAGGQESAASADVTRYTLTNVPTSPTATAASSTQINLSWTAPSGGAARYHVRYSGDGYASDIYDNTATSFSDTGRSANTQYIYRIYGVNADGAKSATYAEVTISTLTNVPTSPVATAASTSQINLSWSAPTGGSSRYHVRYSGDGYASDIYDNTATSFSDTGRSANTQYTYRIYGINADGVKSATYAEVSRFTLAVNPNVSASISPSVWHNTTGVTYTNVAGFGNGGVTKYKYVWSQTASHTWSGSDIDEWTASTLSKTMNTGSNWLHVKAYNGDNISASTGSEATYGPYNYDGVGPAGTIVINTSEFINNNVVSLNLSATDTVSGVYQMRFSNSSTPLEWSAWEVYSPTKPGWDLADILYGGTSAQGPKAVYVQYSDNAGNVAQYSDTIFWDEQLPANPTSITSTKNSSEWDNNLAPQFSWSGATDPDPASGIKGYWVYFGTDSGADPKISTGLGNFAYIDNGNNNFYEGSNYNVASGLVSGTTYYLKIRAVDNALNDGANSYTEGQNLFMYKFDNVSPSSISTISVSPTGWSSIDSFDFSWMASSDSESGIKQYTYVRKTAEGQDEWESWDPVGRFISPGATTVSAIQSLYSGVNTFKLKAIDNAGNDSAEVYVNYLYSPPVSGPTNVAVDYSQSQSQTVNMLRFSWDAYPNALGYYYSINTTPTMQNSTFVDTTSTGFKQFNGVINNTNNIFYVVTEDQNGDIGWSNPTQASFTIDTVVPGVPSALSIIDSSSRESSRWQLTIGWDEPQSLTPDFDGYIIERSTDGLIFSNLDTVSRRYDNTIPNGYLDTNLSNSTTYYYRVRSKDNTGNISSPSQVVSRMPTGKYTSPPTYTSNPIADPKATMVTISWTTNRPSNTIVQYGLTQAYGQEVSKSTEQVTEHKIDIFGLTPGETYYFRVQSLDEDRDYSPDAALSAGYQFSTSQAPGISNVSTSEIRLTSAIITWKTTSSATSRILYGTTMAYGSVYNDTSGSQTTTHTVKIDGLKDSTTYHYRIQGTDIEGNMLLSDNYVFETLTFPRLSNLTIEQVPNTPTSTVKVSFSSNVPTTSLVTFSGAGARDAAKYGLVTEHEMLVSGLRDNTSYSVAVRGRDQYGNEAVSLTTSHKTDFDTRPPVISDITVETSITGYGVDARGQIIVSWNTDEPATSQIEYGEGVAGGEYSAKTQEDTGFTQNHVVIISDLKPSAPYHFRVVSRDGAGNTGKSGDNSVLTQQASESIIDLIIKSLQSTIGWIFSAFSGGGV